MNSPNIKSNQVTYLEIAPAQAGQRIDNFLQTQLKGVPKSYIYRILRKGEIRVNKGRIKPTYRLQAGDSLRLPPVRLAKTIPPSPQAAALQILQAAIIYEDNYLFVLNKPAGFAVHGGSGIHYGVIEGLRVLYPHLSQLELVHRLDRETSGCLLVAKKRSMLRRLHSLIQENQVEKSYLALVRGYWPTRQTQISAPLQKNVLKSGERIVRVAEDGKPATTFFSVEKRYSQATLLNVRLQTGRTHQIRVHTNHAHHPIAGDQKYGDETFNQQMQAYQLNRLFLHANRLALRLDDYQLTVEAPLSPALQTVLTALEKKNG